jgi:hypothetical protein
MRPPCGHAHLPEEQTDILDEMHLQMAEHILYSYHKKR